MKEKEWDMTTPKSNSKLAHTVVPLCSIEKSDDREKAKRYREKEEKNVR
jgi:hypothetical protein